MNNIEKAITKSVETLGNALADSMSKWSSNLLEWEKDKKVKERLINNRDKLLRTLQNSGGEGISNVKLNMICGSKWSARMSELRRLGHIIKSKKIDGVSGLYRYFYCGQEEPDEETPLMRLQTLISKEHFQVVDADRLYELLIENNLFVSSKGNYESKE